MPSTVAPSPQFTTYLQPAQRAWECMPRGAEIMVLQGEVCVYQRQLLAETWVQVPVWLGAGERYRVLTGGWLELEARGAATLAVLPAVGWLERWAKLLRTWGRGAGQQVRA
jgi:hypothetical protein